MEILRWKLHKICNNKNHFSQNNREHHLKHFIAMKNNNNIMSNQRMISDQIKKEQPNIL